MGIPTLRLKSDYLAIATLGFGEIIRVVILNLDVVGGARGFTGIPALAGFFWVYLFAVVTVLTVHRMVRSARGLAFLAVREDDLAAEVMGIDATRYKVTAFLVGSFFAGIAGGLFAHFDAYLHTNSFTFMRSIEIIVMVVLGGMGSISGSIASAALLTVLPEVLRGVGEYRMVIYSATLIVLMLTARDARRPRDRPATAVRPAGAAARGRPSSWRLRPAVHGELRGSGAVSTFAAIAANRRWSHRDQRRQDDGPQHADWDLPIDRGRFFDGTT